MCRIAGLISNNLNEEQIKETVQTMCNSLQHGGPDDEGIYYNAEAKIALGNRRLSIIDLSTNGHQPMADIAKKTWITFNGEIYNYRELRKELIAAGAKFNSDTDTEVILQAYLFWGTAAFAKLKGMFAFALYDSVKECTLLVRDTNGIKPLYYFINDGQLAFASEIRAFKQADITHVPDERWPVWLLALGHIPEPYTTLKNVLTLPKGHYLNYSKTGAHTINSFIIAGPTNFITDEKTAIEGIRDLLQKAINRQMIADAPIGVFLSGGIDSSLITLLACQHKEQELKTLSVFFDEKNYDERIYQDAVLNKIDCQSFKYLVKQQDFEKYLPDILNAMDMPTTDGINTWFISKYAHQAGLKAVLSGIGADELFGGYPSFNRIKYLTYFKKLPSFAFDIINIFNKGHYKRIDYLRHRHPLADFLSLRGLYTPDTIARVLNTDEREVNNILFGTNNFPPLGPYNKQHAAWFETNLYMQNQLLRDTDVMSMNNGLEVRVPFLDEDFKQFVEQVDTRIRFNKHQPKKLLIDSFKNILPAAVWDRPKMGFTFPLKQWMMDNKSITDETAYSGKAAKQIIKEFKKGQIHWSKVFALYQVQKHV